MNEMTNYEPPLYQVTTQWNEKDNSLSYIYNEREIVTVYIPDRIKPSYRDISDGNLCSNPMTQQMFISLPQDLWAKVKISFSLDAINMRPKRAQPGQAILGQLGTPLIYDANGIYDINHDFLFSWHGCEWRWLDNSIQMNEDSSNCTLEVKLGTTPWILLFRMQYYRTHLGFKYHEPWMRKPDNKAVTGWCSWEAFYRNVNSDKILETVDFLSRNFKEFGLEYIQIDDGYQGTPQPVGVDDNYYDIFLKTNKKFPNGHSDIISPIRKEGFEPGIWTNASITNPGFASQAPFIIKDDNGDPIECIWLGYCMDCTDQTIDEQVKPLYRDLKELGYTYFKTDSIRHLLYDGLRKMVGKGLLSNEEANRRFRNFMQGIRDSIGNDAYFLACWGVLSEVVGYADACRIATDAGPSWNQIRMQLFESARWFSTQRILFTNDPDHVCVRADIEYARSVLSLITLSGSLYMLSDPVEDYDSDRISMIRRTIPTLETMAAETGSIDYTEHAWGKVFDWDKASTSQKAPFGSLWSTHFHKNGMNWTVAGRFAIEKLEESTIPLEKLGLNPENQYIAYDFWEDECLGIVTDNMTFKPLNMGHCQITVLRVIKGEPCLIGSDRHISMDAISVVSEQYCNGVLKLDLDGVKGMTFKYWIYMPAGMRVLNIKSNGTKVLHYVKDQISVLEVFFSYKKTKLEMVFEQS